MIKVILPILLGGFIGLSVVSRLEGFLLGAVFGYVLMELFRLRRRVAQLEESLQALRERPLDRDRAHSVEPAVDREMTFDVVGSGPESPEAREQALSGGSGDFSSSPVGEGVSPSTAASPVDSATGPPPKIPLKPGHWESWRRRILEWITGGNLLVKVGVLVLFVGVAFLVRYAAERQILPIEVRLAAVALGAVALLIVGWRLRERRRTYALVLQGGGVAVLYLTVFGSMRLYGLIPPSLAFLLLMGLALISGTLAVLQDARVLASFGSAGGFAAPILASTGQGSHVLLFSYYAVLNLGIIGVAWFRAWRELNLIGFLFTFTIGTAWGVLTYQSDHFSTTQPFLILFFLLYVTVAVLFALRQPPNLKGYVDGPIVFGLPIIVFALQNGLVKPYPHGLAWSAFSLAAFYIGTAWVVFLKAPKSLRLMAEAFLAIGAAFGTLAVPLALDNRWTAAAWAMEGAALVWIGVRQDRLLPRLAGMILQVAAGVAFLSNLPGTYGTWPIVNGFWLGCAVVSVAGLFTSWCIHRYRERVRRLESFLGIFFGVWGLIWWYGAGLRELEAHVPAGHRLGCLILFLSVSSLMCDVLRVSLSWPFLGYPGWAVVPTLALVALNLFGERGHPFQNGGWWGWPLGLASCYAILRRQDHRSAFPGWESFLHPPCLWLSLFVVTWEMSHRVGVLVSSGRTWSMAVWGFAASMLMLIVTLHGDRIPWPVGRHRKAYRVWANAGICVFLGFWVLLTFLETGDPAPLPYFPILSPIDLTTAFAFLTVLLWAQHLRNEFAPLGQWPAAPPVIWMVPSVYGSMVFLWLNAILARTLHHWAGLAFSAHGLMRSMLFQAGLSILWSVTALCIMVYATNRRFRALWMVGAGLLGVTVVKLFLMDLARSGTLGRVVSFITVGVLILVVGYFSPVPPRPKEEVSQ
jgi:uncharacterized membrane protein